LAWVGTTKLYFCIRFNTLTAFRNLQSGFWRYGNWIEQYKKIKSKIVIITKTGQHTHRLLNWVRPHAFNAQAFHAWGQSCIVTKGTKYMQNLSRMESVRFPDTRQCSRAPLQLWFTSHYHPQVFRCPDTSHVQGHYWSFGSRLNTILKCSDFQTLGMVKAL
jgi:hypothetical protein